MHIHIVTDSTAQFTQPHAGSQSDITVVPNTVTIAGRAYKEGVDLSTEDALRLSIRERVNPVVTSPDEAQFADVYRRLASRCDAIISIHPSRKIFSSWDHASAAASQIAGPCEIVVIDSQTVSAGQAMLVRAALQAARMHSTVEDVVRAVRGTVDRIYSAFYVETVNSIFQTDVLDPSHIILGAMLGVKPFLSIEDGVLKPIEKVRSRSQAIERLVEFVVEFTDIDEVIILQNKTHLSEQTRTLQDRLAVEFSDRHFPYMQYGPSLAALIGTDAMGVILLESEMDYLNDDY